MFYNLARLTSEWTCLVQVKFFQEFSNLDENSFGKNITKL